MEVPCRRCGVPADARESGGRGAVGIGSSRSGSDRRSCSAGPAAPVAALLHTEAGDAGFQVPQIPTLTLVVFVRVLPARLLPVRRHLRGGRLDVEHEQELARRRCRSSFILMVPYLSFFACS